jgi:hypothetical protein
MQSIAMTEPLGVSVIAMTEPLGVSVFMVQIINLNPITCRRSDIAPRGISDCLPILPLAKFPI